MATDVAWNRCLLCAERSLIFPLKCPKNQNSSTAAQALAKYENLHDNLHKLWDAGLQVDVQ